MRLVPAGLLLLVIGSVLQVMIFIESRGNDVIKAPERLVWSGIMVSVGIVALFAGAVLLTAGRFKPAEQPPDPHESGDSPQPHVSGQ